MICSSVASVARSMTTIRWHLKMMCLSANGVREMRGSPIDSGLRST